MQPKVSIIIPAFNAGSFLKQAIASVRKQSQKTEIILVDSGSTDGAAKACQKEVDCYIRLEQKVTPAIARNQGLTKATGRFIGFLDADDIMRDGSLMKLLKALKETRVKVVGGYFREVIDKQGKVLASHPPPTQLPRRVQPIDYFSNSGIKPALWLYLFCRSVFDEIGVLDPSLPFAEDLDFMLRISSVSPVFHVPVDVAQRRVHEDNFSGSWDAEAGIFRLESRQAALKMMLKLQYANQANEE